MAARLAGLKPISAPARSIITAGGKPAESAGAMAELGHKPVIDDWVETYIFPDKCFDGARSRAGYVLSLSL